jgi:predicted nucleotidyltransferase
MIITQEIIDKIHDEASLWGVKKLILFGSALNDPQNAHDIDLAAEPMTWDLLGYIAKLEEEIGITIDIVPLKPSNRFTRTLEANGKVIYESN